MLLYAYIMVWDTGFAPAFHDGKLSLACCKSLLRPHIASEFSQYDGEIYLIGLCGKMMAKRHSNAYTYRPIYIARITNVISSDDYFRSGEYASRPDCKYEYDDTKQQWCALKKNPHHEKEGPLEDQFSERDIFYIPRKPPEGKKPKRYNNVLISEDFIFYGKNAANTQEIESVFDKISKERAEKPRSDRTPIALSESEKRMFKEWFEAQNKTYLVRRNDHVHDYFEIRMCRGECKSR